MKPLPPRPSLEHHLDHHTIRKVADDGTVTFEVEQRWLHLPHVISAEENLKRWHEETDAHAENDAHDEAARDKIRELTKHPDPAVAFLAAQLLRKR